MKKFLFLLILSLSYAIGKAQITDNITFSGVYYGTIMSDGFTKTEKIVITR